MRFLKQIGIKIIVDLREKNSADLKKFVNQFGFDYFSCAMNNSSLGHLINIPTPKNYANYYFATLELCSDSILKFFRVLSQISSLQPVLFGCSMGKDRTGIVAYLLLNVLQADIENIYNDYVMSTDYLKGDRAVEEFLKARNKFDPKRCVATKETIKIFHEQLKEKYNSPLEYLVSIGFCKEEIRSLFDKWKK